MVFSRHLWRATIDQMVRRVPPARPRYRPRLEALEDRLAPAATLTVNSVLDTNARDANLTLREAILVNNRTLAVGTLSAAEQAQVSGAPTNADADTIAFNIPGDGVRTIQPLTGLPIFTDPAVVDGYTQPGSSVNTNPTGFNAVLNIELDGRFVPQTGGPHGLRFQVGGDTVRGMMINRFRGAGILLFATTGVGNSVIEGNILSTDAAGTIDIGNGNAVQIGDSDNRIGGTTPAARNIISGRSFHGGGNSGVDVRSFVGGAGDTPFRNVIVGNFIGTDPSGTLAIGQGNGVFVSQNARDTRIGGTTAAERNIISGNDGDGVGLANAFHHVVQGNYIGTDVTGTVAVPNSDAGISLGFGGGGNALIGGDMPGAGNLISGNNNTGITISIGQSMVIQGNRIGVTASGAPLGNRRIGIIHANGTDTLIAGNLIAYNGTTASDAGIDLAGNGSGVRVQGNEIRNNVGDGIRASSLTNAPPKLIGGRGPGEGNIISANSLRGVNVPLGTRIEIVGNSMSANGRLGIALGGGGITGTPNDTNDPDTGPNQLQNYPELSLAQGGSTTQVAGTLNSIADRTYNLDFYASATADPTGFGEGQRYLGTLVVVLPAGVNTMSFSGTVSGVSAAGEVLTVTATDADGNTSEFSQVLSIAAPPPPSESRLVLVLDDPSTPGVDVILADEAPVGFVTRMGPSTHADTGTLPGHVLHNGPVGRFIVVVATAISKPAVTNQLVLNVVAVSGSAGTLVGMASDTHYVSVAGSNTVLTPIGGNTYGTVTFVETVDPTNTSFASEALATSVQLGPFGGGAFSGTNQISFTTPTPSLFSLTKTIVIQHDQAAYTGVGAYGVLVADAPREKLRSLDVAATWDPAIVQPMSREHADFTTPNDPREEGPLDALTLPWSHLGQLLGKERETASQSDETLLASTHRASGRDNELMDLAFASLELLDEPSF